MAAAISYLILAPNKSKISQFFKKFQKLLNPFPLAWLAMQEYSLTILQLYQDIFAH
jgi:hypothetical protein